jgi:hypothetical protein
MPPPPDDGNYVSKKYGEKCVEYFQEKIFGDRETYIENIFLDIAEKKFEAMQITIGPMVDDSKRKEIKDLCALNGIENIVDSILKNKIRL